MSTPLSTLVAIPGLGLGVPSWRPSLHRLSTGPGSEVRLLPGFGLPARHDEDLAPRSLAVRVLPAVATGEDGVVLLAHSAGCQIAAHVAALEPERVAALVLVGPTTDPRAVTWRRLVSRWLASAVHETPRQVPVVARQYARTTLAAMARGMEAARHDDILDTLSRVTAPVLVLRGRHDAICPDDWAGKVAGLGGHGSRAVTLQAGAHMVPYTHGRLVADAIADFLRT